MAGKSSIEYIRRAKNAEAKINKVVTYGGHPYRIAWADGDALVLRSELRVHPGDDSIDYNPEEEDLAIGHQGRKLKALEKKLELMQAELEAYSSYVVAREGDMCPSCWGCGLETNKIPEEAALCPMCEGSGHYESKFQNRSGLTEEE